jgi:hypothetical protein
VRLQPYLIHMAEKQNKLSNNAIAFSFCVKQLVEKMEQYIKESDTRFADLEAKYQELLEKINRTSKNSSSPLGFASLAGRKPTPPTGLTAVIRPAQYEIPYNHNQPTFFYSDRLQPRQGERF